MKTLMLAIFLLSIVFLGSCQDIPVEPNKPNNSKTNILILQVDCTTNTFEAGKELTFSKEAKTFTMTNEYKSPGDFGYIKLFYSEINEMLFYGTIIWNGCGKIQYPENWLKAGEFDRVSTKDYIVPKNGFEGSTDITDYKYSKAWSSVEYLVKVREYLISNPDQKVKVFLYQPSVGMGNPADWKWIFFLKK